jgi:hypothetical protein
MNKGFLSHCWLTIVEFLLIALLASAAIVLGAIAYEMVHHIVTGHSLNCNFHIT